MSSVAVLVFAVACIYAPWRAVVVSTLLCNAYEAAGGTWRVFVVTSVAAVALINFTSLLIKSKNTC